MTSTLTRFSFTVSGRSVSSLLDAYTFGGSRMPKATSAPVRLSLLGVCLLHSPGAQEPVAVPGTAKRLLALLALSGPRARPYVAGTIWPDLDEVHAQGALRSAIYRLNHIEPDLLDCRDDVLMLGRAVAVDVHVLRCCCEAVLSGSVDDEVGPILLRHNNELLPGWYDDWVVFERERLRQLRLQALEVLGARLLAENRLPEAAQAALEAITIEPLLESAQRMLVRIHLAADNSVEAIRQYDLYRQLLHRELGIEPSPVMRSLIDSVVVGAAR
jgi:DNA-binding SARP family transcriptional activator